MKQKVLSISLIIFFFGCNMVSDDDSSNIAKYGDSYLSKEDFSFLMSGVKKDDSVSRANYIINEWAIEKILNERAELNLNDDKLQKIESLVDEYKSSLLSESIFRSIS